MSCFPILKCPAHFLSLNSFGYFIFEILHLHFSLCFPPTVLIKGDLTYFPPYYSQQYLNQTVMNVLYAPFTRWSPFCSIKIACSVPSQPSLQVYFCVVWPTADSW